MHGLPPESLVESNLRLVDKIIEPYRDSAPHADLRAAGLLGLVEAARRFEPARGYRFSTFAWRWIKGCVLSELRRSHVVAMSDHTARVVGKRNEAVAPVLFGLPAIAVDGEQEPAADRCMRLRALEAAIDALPTRRHRAVITRALQGLGPEDIGKALRVPLERVVSLLDEAQGLLTVAMANHHVLG